MYTMNSYFKRGFQDILTGDMDESYGIEVLRRIAIINIISIIGIIALSSLGIVAFFQSNFTLGYFDFTVAIILTINLFYLRRTKNYIMVSYFGIFSAATLFFYLLITGGVNNSGILWYYTFPLFALSILGSIRGAIVTFILLIPSILLLETVQ